MNPEMAIIAAADPQGGPVLVACGITWVLMAPTSAVAAVVSAALCPFARTVRQAHRLARWGVWSGTAGCAAMAFGILLTAREEGQRESYIRDTAVFLSLNAIAPALSFITRSWSYHKILALKSVQEVQGMGNRGAAEAPSSGEPVITIAPPKP